MSSNTKNGCTYAEYVYGFVLGALSSAEAAEFAPHLAECASCRSHVDALRGVADSFVDWPSDILRPSPNLWDRLSARLELTDEPMPAAAGTPAAKRFEWKAVAPGISVMLLATDRVRDRVSMLVRLEPKTDYPPHRHAGLEELYLLDGELIINDTKIYPGDYNRAMAPTSDYRVYSETGCTCVLITSPSDVLQ